jgi:ADP-ribosyl-[dinitrogen reductase] hydrolase
MRNLPVLLATLNQPGYFSDWSLQQCHITHNNPLSDAATLTLGRMARHLISGQDLKACKKEADLLIDQYSEFAYTPYPGKASGYIVDTVQTVLHYLFSTDSLESCLIATVNQGNVADTTVALAGMLAGARYGIQQIPQRWLARLAQQVTEQIRRQTAELISLADSIS